MPAPLDAEGPSWETMTTEPRGSPSAQLACVLAASLGCVDTGAVALTAPPLCISTESAADPELSVVHVEGDLRLAGITVCSGYAITPSIVLTDSVCLVMPPNLVASDLDQPIDMPSFEGLGSTYFADVAYRALCDVDAGWSPSDPGTLEAWLGDPIPAAQLSVSVPNGEEPLATSGVRDVLFPHAQSRCFDNMAALILAEPLPLPHRPLRLSDDTEVGTAVIMSSLDASQRATVARDTTIEAVTGEASLPGVPPRSLLLNRQSCLMEPGGGVLAAASGAMIGMMEYGTGDSCVDSTGKTLAVRLSSYTAMLLEAAEAAPDILQLEPSPLLRTPAPLPTCPRDE